MKKFNKQHYADIQQKTAEALQQVYDIQLAIHANPKDANLYQREREALGQYKVIAKAERYFYQQKSKETRLKHGDQGTSFFFASLAQKGQKSLL